MMQSPPMVTGQGRGQYGGGTAGRGKASRGLGCLVGPGQSPTVTQEPLGVGRTAAHILTPALPPTKLGPGRPSLGLSFPIWS